MWRGLFKRLGAQRPGSKLINLCFSGATTSDVLREQLDSGVAAAPQLVTLGIGINDIGHGVSLEQFAKNYEQILARIKNDTARDHCRYQHSRYFQRAAHSRGNAR